MPATMLDPASGSRVSMPAPAPGIAALALRLVGRRHVDLHRVSSAICR